MSFPTKFICKGRIGTDFAVRILITTENLTENPLCLVRFHCLLRVQSTEFPPHFSLPSVRPAIEPGRGFTPSEAPVIPPNIFECHDSKMFLVNTSGKPGMLLNTLRYTVTPPPILPTHPPTHQPRISPDDLLLRSGVTLFMLFQIAGEMDISGS